MPLILSKKTVIKFTILLCFSAVLFLPIIASAQEDGYDPTCRRIIVKERTAKEPPESKGLEVTYPGIKGVVPVVQGEEAIPIFIKYIFYFAIAVAGFVAFGVLVYNGVKALSTAVNPSALAEARSGIIAGLLGIVLLLGSAILLNTINPQLTRLALKRVEEKTVEERTGASAGVYLLGGENETENIETPLETIKIRKNLQTISNIEALSAREFDNKTESVCVNPLFTESLFYNAILYTKDDYKGDCKIFYKLIGGEEWPTDRTGIGIGGGGQVSIIGGNVKGDVSAVKVFTRKFLGGEAGKDFSEDFAVRLYKHPGRVDDPEDPNDVCEIDSFTQAGAGDPSGIYVKTIQEACPGQCEREPCKKEPWEKDQIQSIEVGHGWILAAFQNEDNSGMCEVFGEGMIEEMSDTYIGRCEAAVDTQFFRGLWKPCVSSIAVFKGLLAE